MKRKHNWALSHYLCCLLKPALEKMQSWPLKRMGLGKLELQCWLPARTPARLNANPQRGVGERAPADKGLGVFTAR